MPNSSNRGTSPDKSRRPLQGEPGGKNTAYTMQRRLNANKTHEFSLIEDFTKNGYRNREDITILPPGVLVKGSYNVVTNVGGRVGVVKGYTLDGQADSTLAKIGSSYDFTKLTNLDTHVRTWSTYFQYRYVNPVTDVVSWVTLEDNLIEGNAVNYATFFDTAQSSISLMFVNQSPILYRWGGAVGSFDSATSNTITLMGTRTWAQLGFDAPTGTVKIGSTTYAYTGGTSTTTITGVTPDPTIGGHVTGDPMAQEIILIPNSSLTGISSTFENALIANLDNQLWIGALNSSVIYTSKVNDYTDYTNSDPRLVGEGNTGYILDYPTAFINQDQNLLIASGKDIWYQTLFTDTTVTTYPGGTSAPSVTVVYQSLSFQRLKTTARQAAQSQAATTKIKNNIAYLSFEPMVNSLGTIQDYLDSPQTVDLSYPIVNDMNRYDFTDAAMIYFRQFLYLSIPKAGVIRIYNMTQPKTHYWEAPVTYPIGRFSIIDDELYGHGYHVPETYKLFVGYTFNGNPIPAKAMFSFLNYGTRHYPKDFTQFYLDGYITSNCVLTFGMNFDMSGCQRTRTYTLRGDQEPQVCVQLDSDASLGKAPLGSRPLSGITQPIDTAYSSDTGLPPRFRGIKQVSKLPFYELQMFLESVGSDQQWEMVAMGPNAGPATEGAVSIQF